MGRRTPSRRIGIITRLVAASLIVTMSLQPAFSDPGDIFTVAAPAATSTPSASSPIASGDASVSTQTGALTYGYAIPVPPGRHGVQPQLSLSYSSQASIYGGLASGWSLSGIPVITEDTTRGRLWSTAFPGSLKNYASSMAGGRPLILVTEPGQGIAQYRAQNDTRYVRYERFDGTQFWWRARSPDG